MAYTFQTDSTHQWLTDDQPLVYGTVVGNKATLYGVLVELSVTRGPYSQQKAALTDVNKYFKVELDELTKADSGRVFVRALEGDGGYYDIDTAINATDTTVEATHSHGIVEHSRTTFYGLIDEEFVKFSVDGTTITFINRGLWGSLATSHAQNANLYELHNVTTLKPYYSWRVIDPSILPEGV